MTIDQLRTSGKLIAFGEGDEKHGYAQADNWEPADRKLRHAFWEGAEFEAVANKPGCYLATLVDKDGNEIETKRVVFVK